MSRPSVTSLVTFLVLALAAGSVRAAPRKLLVVVSLDGFRWDYLTRPEAAWIKAIGDEGVKAGALIPCFPTKTYPNHYSIATGLYPEHHGLVSNTCYDPVLDATFSPSNQKAVEDARWWGGEPVWVTAQKQGHVTGVNFWPGSEAPIGGVRPAHWRHYTDDVSLLHQVEEVLSWLDEPEDRRPDFLMVYFRDPDVAGHAHGPDSPEVGKGITAAVEALKALHAGLEKRGHLETTNFIVVSDHGMTPVSRDRVIFLDQHVDPSDFKWMRPDPVSLMWPKDGHMEAILKRIATPVPHLKFYRKEEIPAAYHFSDHQRVPPLIAVADAGWTVQVGGIVALASNVFFPGGAHGYADDVKDMWGIFVARGPAFQKGLQVEPFRNIHLYHLMCRLLEIEPAANDGDPAVTTPLIQP